MLAPVCRSSIISFNRTFSTTYRLLRHNKVLHNRDAFLIGTAPQAVHLIDDECMRVVVKKMCPDPVNETAKIIECSPGPAFLTKKLISAGVPHVHLIEHHDCDYLSLVNDLVAENPTRVTLKVSDEHTVDFARDLRLFMLNISADMVDAVKSDWQDPGIQAKIFVPLPPFVDLSFVKTIFYDLCSSTGIFAAGRTQIFAALPFDFLVKMMADPVKRPQYYSYQSVIAQTVFDVEVIDKFPISAFVPKITARKKKRLHDSDPLIDAENLFFISIVPKATISKDVPPEYWNDYRFFVRQAMLRKSGFVLQFFEKYFPNCGTRLIRIGIPLYARFNEMTPSDFLKLFNECLLWPDYNTSTFRMASATCMDLEHELEDVEDDQDDASDVSGTGRDSAFAENQ